MSNRPRVCCSNPLKSRCFAVSNLSSRSATCHPEALRGIFPSRSHALRGNAALDAPRPASECGSRVCSLSRRRPPVEGFAVALTGQSGVDRAGFTRGKPCPSGGGLPWAVIGCPFGTSTPRRRRSWLFAGTLVLPEETLRSCGVRGQEDPRTADGLSPRTVIPAKPEIQERHTRRHKPRKRTAARPHALFTRSLDPRIRG